MPTKKTQIVTETDFEKTYHISLGYFDGLEGLKGFELYQKYRDGFFKLVANKEYQGLSSSVNDSFKTIYDFQFVDRAYLDNFMLCFALQMENPKSYEEFSSTIDKYIKPDKRSEGLQYLNKELACLFVHILNVYGDVSVRQASNISKQIFSIAESEIKSRISNIQKQFSNFNNDEYPPKIVLALLFIFLVYKNANWEKLRSVSPETARTKKSHNEAVNSYKNLRKRIANFYIQDNISFIKKYPEGLHSQLEESPDLLKFDQYDLDNLDDEKLALIIGFSLLKDLMPNFLINPSTFIALKT